MKPIEHFNKAHAKTLKAFLDSPQRPEGTLNYGQTVGFLFSVACSPEMIKPSEWLPIIYTNDSEDTAASAAEIEALMSALMALYNELNRQVRHADVALLPGFDFHDDPMANLEDNSPISQWSQGFMEGYDWLSEVWTEYLPEELEEPAGAHLLVLSFFCSRQMAEALHSEANKNADSLESMATTMQEHFEGAMHEFAELSFIIQEAVYEQNYAPQVPIRHKKIGRNTPCPCGSGKKYKKCCATKLH
jgi:yecA family protein